MSKAQNPDAALRRFERRLAIVGVELVDLSTGELSCTSCCKGWWFNLRPGGRLYRGFWKCPQGCNDGQSYSR
jgi:hypothetical protein